MVIFHSYVSLPEGISIILITQRLSLQYLKFLCVSHVIYVFCPGGWHETGVQEIQN